MRYLSVTEIAKVRFLPVRLGTFLKMQRNNLEDILDFHVKFERIHPFQDGNGRVGRLIMFKECLKYNMAK